MKASFKANTFNIPFLIDYSQNDRAFSQDMTLNHLDQPSFLVFLQENANVIFKMPSDSIFISSIVNRIDQIFQDTLKQYISLLQSNSHIPTEQNQDIARCNAIFLQLLTAIIRSNASFPKIPSIDCIVALLPLCADFNLIQKALEVIFLKLNESGLLHDTVWIETVFPKICRYASFFFQHYNLGSFYSISLVDTIRDDWRFSQYMQENPHFSQRQDKRQETMEYKNALKFETLIAEQTKPMETLGDILTIVYSKENLEREIQEESTLDINVPDLGEKYANRSHIWICNELVRVYDIKIDETSPMWEALAFKIRACMNKSSFAHRINVICAAINSLRVLIFAQKLCLQKKEFQKYTQALPLPAEITAFALSCFDLLNLKGNPDLHKDAVRCLTALLAALDPTQNEYKNFFREVKSKIGFIHTLLKDCIVYRIENKPFVMHIESQSSSNEQAQDVDLGSVPTHVYRPKLLPLETVSSPDFLSWLLNLVHVKLAQACNEKEQSQRSGQNSQLYSYTGFVNLLLRILEPPGDEHYLYNIEAAHLVLDSLSIIMNHQSFAVDLNVVDRLFERAYVELKAFLDIREEGTKGKYFHFTNRWQLVEEQDHLAIFHSILKVLKLPLDGLGTAEKGPLAQMIAAKVEDITFWKMINQALERDILEEETFLIIVKLVTDMIKAFPERLEALVELGIIQEILKQVEKSPGESKEYIGVMVRFVRMIGKKKEGYTIERKYMTIERLFEKSREWESSKKARNEEEPLGDIGKEIGELIKENELYRECVGKSLLQWMQNVEEYIDDFTREWAEESQKYKEAQKKAEEDSKRMEEEATEGDEHTRRADVNDLSFVAEGENSRTSNVAVLGTVEHTQTMNMDPQQFVPLVLFSDLQQLDLLQYFGLKNSQEKDSKRKVQYPLPQDFEKRFKKSYRMIQALCSISPHVFTSEENVRTSLVSQGFFESLFHILSFPLLPISETNPHAWVSICFKQIATKLSVADQEVVQKKIYKEILVQIDEIEKLTGKLSKIQDFSSILSDDLCYEIRVKQLYAVVTREKMAGYEALTLIGKLSYIEFLSDFMRYSSEVFLTNHETENFCSRLKSLFLVIMDQARRSDCEFLRRELEEIGTHWKKLSERRRKEKIMKCISTISTATHSAHRLTCHQTITKLFKKIMDYQAQGAKIYSDVLVGLIRRIEGDKLVNLEHIENKKESLWDLLRVHHVLTYLQEFLVLAPNRKLRVIPDFILSFYEKSGFQILLQAMESLFVFVEANNDKILSSKDHSLKELETGTIDTATNILFNEVLGLSLYKISQINRQVCLYPIQLPKLNGQIATGDQTKLEDFFGVCSDVIDRVIRIFKKMNVTLEMFYDYHLEKKITRNKETEDASKEKKKGEDRRDEFYSNLGNAVDCVFDYVKRIYELKKESQDERRIIRDNMFGPLMRHRHQFLAFGLPRERENPEQQMVRPETEAVGEGNAENVEEKEKLEEVEDDSEFPKQNIKRISRDTFFDEVMKNACQDIKEHILSNIFKFEGYDVKAIDSLKHYLENIDTAQKQAAGEEIVVAMYKVFKHGVNTFWPGQKFLGEFKIEKGVIKSVMTLVDKPLKIMSLGEVSFLGKLQRLHSVLPLIYQHLTYFPNVEENLVRKPVVLGLVRFVHKLLRQLRRDEHVKEDQEIKDRLFEVSGSIFEGVMMLLYTIFKTKSPKKEVPEHQGLYLNSAEKKDFVKILIGLLRECKELSIQENRSVVMGKDRLRIYLKVLNQVMSRDIECGELFVENGGLRELIYFKVDNKDLRRVDLTRDFSELCTNLAKNNILDLINLESQVKALFWNSGTRKVKLRAFAEKFSEYFAAEPHGTLRLIKRLCTIEDLEKKRARKDNARNSRVEEGQREESKDRERNREAEGVSRFGQFGEFWDELARRPENREARGNEGEGRERKQTITVCLKSEIEFSKIYVLQALQEPVVGREEVQPVHISEYKAPRTVRMIMKTLIEGLVYKVNEELNSEEKGNMMSEEEGENEHSGFDKSRFSYIFPCALVLQGIHSIVGKYPILIEKTLRFNVSKVCVRTVKDSRILLALKPENQVSFLRYFLRVVVFCTFSLFKNFLLNICTKTNLINDKDKDQIGYLTPYFYAIKKQMLTEIYQILKELVIKGPGWLKSVEEVRLFCGVSGMLVNLLPLRDISRSIFERSKQEDFIGLFNEALKQVESTQSRVVEKIMPYITEPLSILVQYNLYFAVKKDMQDENELKTYDMWMPKEALGTTIGFVENWKKIANIGGRRDDERRHPSISFIEEDSSPSESSQEEGMMSMSDDEDMLEDLQVSIPFEGENSIHEIADEHEDEHTGEERLIERNEIVREERDWRRHEEQKAAEEVEERKVMEQSVVSDDDEELMEDQMIEEEEDQRMGMEQVNDDAISEENYILEAEEQKEGTQDQQGTANNNQNNNANNNTETFEAGASSYPVLLSNSGSSNHPEIQRINSIFQDRSTHFDQQLFAPNSSALDTQISSTSIQSRYDRLFTRIRIAQHGQPNEDNSRRLDFHEIFFERSRNLDDSDLESGLRIFRSLREFLGRGPNQADPLASLFDGIFSNIENRPRTTISIGMPVGISVLGMGVIPSLGNANNDPANEPVRIATIEPIRLDIPTTIFSTTIQRAQPASANPGIENFETRILENFHHNPVSGFRSTDQLATPRLVTPNPSLVTINGFPMQNPQLGSHASSVGGPSASENPFDDLRLTIDEPISRMSHNHGDQSSVMQNEDGERKDSGLEGLDPTFFAELTPDLKQELSLQSSNNAQYSNLDMNSQVPVDTSQLRPEFLNAVPENLRSNLVPLTTNPSQASQDNPAAAQNTGISANQPQEAQPVAPNQTDAPLDNASFVSRLNPETRQEVLQTSDNSFLRSLSPSLHVASQRIGHVLSSARQVIDRIMDFRQSSPRLGREDSNRSANTATAAIVVNLNTRNPETPRLVPQQGSNNFPVMRTRSTTENAATTNNIEITRHTRENISSPVEQGNAFDLFFRRRPSSFNGFRRKFSTNAGKTNRKNLYIPNEKTIEAILGLLYGNFENFGSFPLNLIKCFLSHPSIQYKILHSLVYILTNPDLTQQIVSSNFFPRTFIHDKATLEKNYAIVYQKVSLKILYILENLTKKKAFSFFTTPLANNKPTLLHGQKDQRKPLQCLSALQNESSGKVLDEVPLLELIRLVKNPAIEGRVEHMKLLLNVIYNITKHSKHLMKPQNVSTIPREAESGMGGYPPFMEGRRRTPDNIFDFWNADPLDRINESRNYVPSGSTPLDLRGAPGFSGEFSLNSRMNSRASAIGEEQGRFGELTMNRVGSRNSIPVSPERRTSTMLGEIQSTKNPLQLDQELIQILCSCLWSPNVEDEVLRRLSSTISALCYEPTNFSLFLYELKSLICSRTKQMNNYLATQAAFIQASMPLLDKAANTLELGLSLFEEQRRRQNHERTPEKEAVIEGLLDTFGEETEDSAQLYKVLKVMKGLFEQSLIEVSRQNKTGEDLMRDILVLKRTKSIDTFSREEVKRLFRTVLENEGLQSLWINTTAFLNTLSHVFTNNRALLGLLSQRLQSVLECYFLVYRLLYDEEAYKYYRKGKFVVSKELKKAENIGISRLVNDDEEENDQFKDFEEGMNDPDDVMMQEDNLSVLRKRDKPTLTTKSLGAEEILQLVCDKAKDVLNIMIRQNPGLLRGPLSVVVRKYPHVLDFDNKKVYFKSELKRLRRGTYHHVKLRVSRASLFMDSYAQIMARKPQELRGKLSVEFAEEEAVDAGGVAREWFLELSREILNPHYALFKPAANGSAYQPSPQSCVNQDHLKYFKFVGRVIGKALHDGHMLDCYFTRSFYKHLLGQPLTCKDMEDIDPDYYRNLIWILDNDISGLDLTFCYEAEEFGEIVIRDLIEGGRNISVTEQNKKEYVYNLCYAKMANDIKDQTVAFLEGFHEVIPGELVQIFDSKELELMITGLPEIDVRDLKENTEYHNFTKDSDVIVWLWEIIENFERTQKAAFLQFVTGTSKVPLGGFKELAGMGGSHQKFQIHKSFDTSKLPTAHTCFNQLDLPEYGSKEILKRKLLLAITEGKEGFGFV